MVYQFSIILLYSGLEFIPKEIVDHPQIRGYCRKRKKNPEFCLLDKAFHYKAMRNLKEREMRGRPDIVHIFLLNALESILNKEGKLKIYVHTRNNEIIYVNPITRIPRNYDRFKGVMEKLLIEKRILSGNTILLEIVDKSLEEFVKDFDEKILLWEKGKYVPYYELDRYFSNKCGNILIGIGGFQSGDFPRWILDLFEEKIRIYNQSLMSWTVLNEIIVSLERVVVRNK